MLLEFIERECVLRICPDPVCRRSGQCRARYEDLFCARTHEPADEARDRLSRLLERLAAEGTGDDPLDENDADFEYLLDCRLAELKVALDERERQEDAAALAPG